MPEDYHRLLFIFVDGVGMAPAGPDNPLADGATPALEALLGGPLTSESVQQRNGLLLAPLDATLGVEGLPQSATGQTALLTGFNAPRELGRHVTAFPGPRLRELIARRSLLGEAARRGLDATFANAYTDEYLRLVGQGRRHASVTTCMLRSAGVAPRVVSDLLRGEAVTWDIERDHFGATTGLGLERVEARRAGRDLARLAARHRVTLYETFLTDLAGHRRFEISAAEALRRVDGLVAGVLEEKQPGLTLLLTSDHGNVEDAGSRSHTRNPVPLLVAGPLAERFTDLTAIDQVAPRILECLTDGAYAA